MAAPIDFLFNKTLFFFDLTVIKVPAASFEAIKVRGGSIYSAKYGMQHGQLAGTQRIVWVFGGKNTKSAPWNNPKYHFDSDEVPPVLTDIHLATIPGFVKGAEEYVAASLQKLEDDDEMEVDSDLFKADDGMDIDMDYPVLAIDMEDDPMTGVYHDQVPHTTAPYVTADMVNQGWVNQGWGHDLPVPQMSAQPLDPPVNEPLSTPPIQQPPTLVPQPPIDPWAAIALPMSSFASAPAFHLFKDLPLIPPAPCPFVFEPVVRDVHPPSTPVTVNANPYAAAGSAAAHLAEARARIGARKPPPDPRPAPIATPAPAPAPAPVVPIEEPAPATSHIGAPAFPITAEAIEPFNFSAPAPRLGAQATISAHLANNAASSAGPIPGSAAAGANHMPRSTHKTTPRGTTQRSRQLARNAAKRQAAYDQEQEEQAVNGLI